MGGENLKYRRFMLGTGMGDGIPRTAHHKMKSIFRRE
jgi:hypothetical protein